MVGNEEVRHRKISQAPKLISEFFSEHTKVSCSNDNVRFGSPEDSFEDIEIQTHPLSYFHPPGRINRFQSSDDSKEISLERSI